MGVHMGIEFNRARTLRRLSMSPVLQLGTRKQRSRFPVKMLHCKQKAQALAKAVTFQATSEANSCFRALITGACVLLCLANILQAANRINRASIKTNIQIKHPNIFLHQQKQREHLMRESQPFGCRIDLPQLLRCCLNDMSFANM